MTNQKLAYLTITITMLLIMIVVWIIVVAQNINQNHDNHLTTNVHCMDSPTPLEEVCMTVTRNESGSYESSAEFIPTKQ